MDDKTKSELEELIEPDYGLLDFFLKSGTLSRREIKDIQSVPSTFERNRKLLNYIEAKDAVKQLKIALAEGNQMHLVNFINSAGGKTSQNSAINELNHFLLQIKDSNNMKFE